MLTRLTSLFTKLQSQQNKDQHQHIKN